METKTTPLVSSEEIDNKVSEYRTYGRNEVRDIVKWFLTTRYENGN